MVGVIPPQPGEQRISSATAALSANDDDDDDDDYGDYDASSISSSSKNKHSVVSSEQVDIVDNYCDSEDELSKTVLIAATSFASVKREPPFVKKEVTFSTVVDDCGDSAGAGTSDNGNDNGVDVDVDVDDDVGDNDDDNISKENLLDKNEATSSTTTKKTVHRLPITPTALISAAASTSAASSSTTTVVVKQQAKTNDNYTQSSSIPPPPSNGLDRQQAGLVRPNPGAYAITHPDFQQENNDNDNNNNDSSTSESETETGSTTTIEPPPLLTATTTATTMVTTDTDQILYDRYENNNPTIQNEDGNNEDNGGGATSLIEAELVKPTIFALDISPIDEVAKKKRKKKIQISIFVGFIVVVIICVVSTVLVNKRNGRSIQEKFKDEHDYECFDSTGELNLAQVRDFIATNYTSTKDTYVICSNTPINIGDPNKNGVVKNGDSPLFILTSNTTVQCDDTYSTDDNKLCVINGGWTQVIIFVGRIEDWMVWFRNEGKDLVLTEEDVKVFYHSLSMQRYDNVTIRGLTFTGNLVNGRNTFGQSIIMNRTGNILLDECIWRDMTAPTGVVLVAVTSKDSPTTTNNVTKLSTQVTIRNSQFTNIEYNHQLIGVYNQILVLNNTTFENITIDHYSPPCSGKYWDVESELIDEKNDTDCLYLMACVGDARCDIQDCCQTNIDASDDEFSYDDNNSNENDEWLYKSKTATVRIDDQSKECGFD